MTNSRVVRLTGLLAIATMVSQFGCPGQDPLLGGLPESITFEIISAADGNRAVFSSTTLSIPSLGEILRDPNNLSTSSTTRIAVIELDTGAVLDLHLPHVDPNAVALDGDTLIWIQGPRSAEPGVYTRALGAGEATRLYAGAEVEGQRLESIVDVNARWIAMGTVGTAGADPNSYSYGTAVIDRTDGSVASLDIGERIADVLVADELVFWRNHYGGPQPGDPNSRWPLTADLVATSLETGESRVLMTRAGAGVELARRGSRVYWLALEYDEAPESAGFSGRSVAGYFDLESNATDVLFQQNFDLSSDSDDFVFVADLTPDGVVVQRSGFANDLDVDTSSTFVWFTGEEWDLGSYSLAGDSAGWDGQLPVPPLAFGDWVFWTEGGVWNALNTETRAETELGSLVR